MYEFTMGGFWFRWSSLDRDSRRLAAWSMIFAIASAVPLSIALARYSYAIGACAGSGDWSRCADTVPSLSPLLSIVALLLAIASALLWARFSARQDEMFNRVQNWALGVAGAWTGAAMAAWSLLSLGGVVPWVPIWAGALLYLTLLYVFWWIAVRRWAY